MVELVIFDCDGVLVDSERLAVRLEARLISELGWPVTEADVVERFVGRSEEYMLGEIERMVGRPVPEWSQRYQSELRCSFEAELRAVDGIVDALDALTIPSCVASSGSLAKMQLTLGLTGLYERFDGRIFSASQVARDKPAPDLFLLAAEQLGVDPPGCVVVEDSASGVQAARAAGMHCIAYAGGVTPADRLAGGDTTVIDSMHQLVAALDTLAAR
ncbi:MAG: HAD family hydrolase [Ilumatobacteraceae bacterium]